MEEILNIIKENPEYSIYVVDGEVQWEKLYVDIDDERNSNDYVSDTETFIDAVTAASMIWG